MKKKIRQYLKQISSLPGLRHVVYFGIEFAFLISVYVFDLLHGPRNNEFNPWKKYGLLKYFKKNYNEEDPLVIWQRYCQFLRAHLVGYSYLPKISILLPVYKPLPEFLEQALQSVAHQAYENWELCIVDDASDSPEVNQVIERFRASYPERVKFVQHGRNRHISETTNTCFSLASGDYVVLLDHDDRLNPNALAEVVRAIVQHDRPHIVYSDEEIINENGTVLGVVYKPDWSEFLHLSKNYTTHLSAYAVSLVEKIGGWALGTEGAQDHDFMMRAVEAVDMPVVHIPIPLYQWRSHEQSTASDGDAAKPYAAVAGAKAVRAACLRRGFSAEVEFEAAHFQYRITPHLPADLPLVTIIIPNRNAHQHLSTCLHSIFTMTTYPRFEVVLVDNGSTDQQTFALYKEYSLRYSDRFRVVRDEGYFNFARLNNFGVRNANGEYLIFLNNDTEILQQDWIDGLLCYAQLAKIGGVGCKLLYNDGSIQHAGIYGAGRLIAGHSGRGLGEEANLPLALNNCVHECLAVTAACMMISKEKFCNAGWFDEIHTPNGYGDVLLGLQLGKMGFLNLYTPYVRLKHYESLTRGKNIEIYERNFLCNESPSALLNDQYLNMNFLHDDHYRVNEPLAIPELPKNWPDLFSYRQ